MPSNLNAIDSILRLKIAYDTPTQKIKNEQFYVTQDFGLTVIAIAGSNDLIDWLQNFNVQNAWLLKILAQREEPWQHFGFEQAASNLAEVFMGSLPEQSVRIVGHSKGAATGVLLAEKLSVAYDIEQVITFGCPRYRKNERRTYEYPVTHYVNEQDIVTFLPTEEWIRDGMDIKTSSELDDYWGWIRDAIYPHFLHNYYEGIRRHYG